MNGKSRRGTLRNTDSFFKDDSVETRKITLTPNLLRDDSSNSTTKSNESKEVSGAFEASSQLFGANGVICSSRQGQALILWRRPSHLPSGRKRRERKRRKSQECSVGFSRGKIRRVNLKMRRRTIRRSCQGRLRDCRRNRKGRWNLYDRKLSRRDLHSNFRDTLANSRKRRPGILHLQRTSSWRQGRHQSNQQARYNHHQSAQPQQRVQQHLPCA